MSSGRKSLAAVHEEMPVWIDDALAARGWSWRGLEDGDYPLSLQDLQWYLIHSDPVRFVECNLINRPEDGGGPWRLFDYQKASMRIEGLDVINKSGAETGKTREIVGLTTFGLTNRRGGIAVVGNAEGTLDEIWDELTYQIDRNPWLAQQLPPDGHRLKPYRKMSARNGNRLVFRPTGHDGEPLRGVHVAYLILGDECAKWASPRIWKELWRAGKPTCQFRLYSVPDGRRDTEFYRLSERAVPLDSLQDGSAGSRKAGDSPERFVLVRWQQPMKPSPYWDAERAAKMEEYYGGRHTDGYLQNVLGLDGEPASSVFPWSQLRACVLFVPDYRAIHLDHNAEEGVLELRIRRQHPGFSLDAEAASGRMLVEREDRVDLHSLDLETWIGSLLPPLDGHLVGGWDPGQDPDPSEILFFRIVGLLKICVLRIQLRRFPYPDQRAVFRAAEKSLQPSFGWGLDSTGVGTVVEQEIRRELEDPERLSGYLWNANVEARSPQDGTPLLDPETKEPRRISTKDQATQVLEYAVPRAQLHIPGDDDFLTQFPSHTCRISPAGKRLFDKTNDHLIDATRAAALRHFDLELGDYAGAPPVVVHTPPDNTTDAARILEAY